MSQKVNDEYYKVIIVRDPFSRLVSAYKDKLVTLDEGGRGPHNFDMRIRKYLKISANKSIRFQQLLEYIEGVADGPLEATNVHFDTFNTLCRPCEVNYDFIGKMETLHQDAEYLFHNILQTNLSLGYLLDASKGPNSKGAKHDQSKQKAIELYRNSSVKLRKAVQSYLAIDCKLFGYDAQYWTGL